VCPTSIAGNYVFYGAKYNPTGFSNELGALETLATIPKGANFGTVSLVRPSYSETDATGNLSGKHYPSDSPLPYGQYSYNGKCFGYLVTNNSDDANTLDIQFMYVSDGGAQIVLTFGPKGVAKDPAGNPIIPPTWTKGGDPGVFFLRKQ